jgi:hypothetical protein
MQLGAAKVSPKPAVSGPDGSFAGELGVQLRRGRVFSVCYRYGTCTCFYTLHKSSRDPT